MWSIKHSLEKCNGCGTVETPHRAHGLCRNCYAKSAGYIWQKAYQKSHREKANAINRKWVAANPAAMNKSRRSWSERHPDKNRGYIQTYRRKHRAPFCLVCGEERVAEWAHIFPHCEGGPVAPWNLIPLCPTHHRCFDRLLLTSEEMVPLHRYIDEAKQQLHELR